MVNKQVMSQSVSVTPEPSKREAKKIDADPKIPDVSPARESEWLAEITCVWKYNITNI